VSAPSGADFHHIPVLEEEVLAFLNVRAGGIYLDATLGAGGHAHAILSSSADDVRLIGIDRDPHAIGAASARLATFGRRFRPMLGRMSELPRLLDEARIDAFDGVLADLGVSSPQLDDPERGFSFQADGPLDMRMDPRSDLRAADVVNETPEDELATIIRTLGDERHARRIARAIVERRRRRPFERTRDLAEVIAQAIPGPRQRIHPATRPFQAIRMHVNQELDELESGLRAMHEHLKIGGRMVIISFHSGEDRRVKSFMKREAQDCLCPTSALVCRCGHQASLKILTPKPIRARGREIGDNPRARSARLRAAERI